MDNRAPSSLPAVSSVVGVPPPALLGISINVNLKRVAVVIDPDHREVDESALPAPSRDAARVMPERRPCVVMATVVDGVEVTSGMCPAPSASVPASSSPRNRLR